MFEGEQDVIWVIWIIEVVYVGGIEIEMWYVVVESYDIIVISGLYSLFVF